MLGSLLGTATRLVNTPLEVVDRVTKADEREFDDRDRFASTPLEELAKSFDNADGYKEHRKR